MYSAQAGIKTRATKSSDKPYEAVKLAAGLINIMSGSIFQVYLPLVRTRPRHWFSYKELSIRVCPKVIYRVSLHSPKTAVDNRNWYTAAFEIRASGEVADRCLCF